MVKDTGAPSRSRDWRPLLDDFEKSLRGETNDGMPLLRDSKLLLVIARQCAELLKEVKALNEQEKLKFQIALREALEAKYEELERPVRRLVELLRLERYGLLSDGVLEELDAIEKALPEQAPAQG
jgi:hypothetical protein